MIAPHFFLGSTRARVPASACPLVLIYTQLCRSFEGRMPGKKFTQREAAKYLARCQNETEVEEVSRAEAKTDQRSGRKGDPDGAKRLGSKVTGENDADAWVDDDPSQVLSCYLYSKASRGHQSPMLARKLQLLGLYCCAM